MYRTSKLSKNKVNVLLDLLSAMAVQHGSVEPPFANYDELLGKIDATTVGDVPWQCVQIQHRQEDVTDESPSWMRRTFDLHFRDPLRVLENQLANNQFHGKFDYAPYLDFNAAGCRVWKDFMSGNWAWKQAVSSTWTTLGSCYSTDAYLADHHLRRPQDARLHVRAYHIGK